MKDSDNACKYLAEKYPDSFASWLLGKKITGVEVLKTELSMEPVRADSVIFLRTPSEILHLELQVKVPQVPPDKPMPLRMLNYWVRLYWKHNLPVTQVLIWLKQISNQAVFENEFVMGLTRHRYQVIRMWEESPALLLQEPALLPLATLCKTENPTQLLSTVAAEMAKIDSTAQRNEISGCTEILAGLRFSKKLIRSLFREDIMKESVIYQDILQQGEAIGKQKEAQTLVLRQLARRFGSLDSALQEQLHSLAVEQVEDLSEALLDFSSMADLVAWLQK